MLSCNRYWVPVVWLPIVFYLSWHCYTTLSEGTTRIVLGSGNIHTHDRLHTQPYMIVTLRDLIFIHTSILSHVYTYSMLYMFVFIIFMSDECLCASMSCHDVCVCVPDFSIPIHKYIFPMLFLTGWFLWSFIEYCIHRFVFHMKPPAHNYYLIMLHFLLHGQHHKVSTHQ